jgi:NAD(P)-dependent dehydrogenase (short-subunit alcohol dehydrogenase family)
MKWPDELIFIPNNRVKIKTTTARLDGQVCVLTGATSGVGYHAAKRLARGGAKLVLLCRNSEKAARVKNSLEQEYQASVRLLQVDLSRLEEVRRAAETILDEYPRIDLLINNAGLHNNRRILNPKGIETVFCVNHLASFLLTRLLLPRIKESAPARILQINSQGHRFGGLDLDDLNWERRRYNGYKGYGASKTAQLLTVWELAEQLEGTGVTINAVHPGGVRTNIGMNNSLLFQWYQRILIWPLLKKPHISGEAIYYLAAAPEMAAVNGRYFNRTVDEKPASHALDRSIGKKIWKISEEWTGLTELMVPRRDHEL